MNSFALQASDVTICILATQQMECAYEKTLVLDYVFIGISIIYLSDLLWKSRTVPNWGQH
jgi:hypothetical protein